MTDTKAEYVASVRAGIGPPATVTPATGTRRVRAYGDWSSVYGGNLLIIEGKHETG